MRLLLRGVLEEKIFTLFDCTKISINVKLCKIGLGSFQIPILSKHLKVIDGRHTLVVNIRMNWGERKSDCITSILVSNLYLEIQ